MHETRYLKVLKYGRQYTCHWTDGQPITIQCRIVVKKLISKGSLRGKFDCSGGKSVLIQLSLHKQTITIQCRIVVNKLISKSSLRGKFDCSGGKSVLIQLPLHRPTLNYNPVSYCCKEVNF